MQCLIVCCLLCILLNILTVTSKIVDSCITPEGTSGKCINIRDCEPLNSQLQSNSITPEFNNYLQQANCGFIGLDPKVCCDIKTQTSTTFTEKPLKPTLNEEKLRLLPNEEVCGTMLVDKLVGGSNASLGDFPWMALIEYQRPNGPGFFCGGVLISKRYVLTAAHCLKGKDLPTDWRISSVRLGEHDTDSDPDCNKQFCAPSAIDVVVIKTIAHEQYDPHDISQVHDIALLRLSRDVEFSQYIKPICLPTNSRFFNMSFNGNNMTVAGWGKTEHTSFSNVKLKLMIPVVSESECKRVYETARVSLSEGQMCAGGQFGKDSCRGDSGGPLMKLDIYESYVNWYVAGIVSFGPTPCGLEGWPGIYTKVSEYVPWILDNIQP